MVMEVSVKSNVREVAKKFGRFHRNQVPFATASALTKTMQAAQKEIQEEIPNRFNVTKKWWLKQQPTGVKIKPATKRQLWASVFTNAYFAPLQEEGGTKKPFKGGRLAVPTDKVRARRNRKSGGVREISNRPNTFFAKTNTGKTALWRRRTKKAYPIDLLYILSPIARIKRRFGFKVTAEEVTAKQFNRIFTRQMIRAIRTAR